MLSRFVQDNGDCRLPCLLGLDPINSNSASVEVFGRYFEAHSQRSDDQSDNLNISGHSGSDSAGASLAFWKDQVRIQISIGASLDQDQIEYIALSAGAYEHFLEGSMEGARILPSHPYSDELLGHFSLSRVLLEYGRPTEIWVMPFPELLPDYPYASSAYPFNFVLLYPDQGFAVQYIGRVMEKNGYLVGCPKTAYFKIASWNPKRTLDFMEIAPYFEGTDSLSVSNVAGFKELQEVTKLSVEDFYQNYQDPNFNECVQTAKDLWATQQP